MKKIIYIFVFLICFISCEESNEKDFDYVTFETSSYDFGVEAGSSSTNEIKVYASKTSNSDRTINIEIVADETTADASAYSIPSSVTLSGNESTALIPITISDINIDSNPVIVLNLSTDDGSFTGDNITLNISQICSLNEVVLDIVFDGYASETSLSLTDSDGASVLTISAGDWADGLETYSSSFCLADGTYNFTITDSYGDGLSYPADGSVDITSNGTTLYSVSGNFGSSASGSFTLGQ